MESSVTKNLETLFEKMENFVTTKTVVGEPIEIGNSIILPLVEVSFGVGAGGMAGQNDAKKNEGSGGGLGAKINPSAVLVIIDGQVQMMNLKNQDSVSKLIDMAPGIINKLNLDGFIDKFKKTDDSKSKEKIEINEAHLYEDGEKIVEKVRVVEESDK